MRCLEASTSRRLAARAMSRRYADMNDVSNSDFGNLSLRPFTFWIRSEITLNFTELMGLTPIFISEFISCLNGLIVGVNRLLVVTNGN